MTRTSPRACAATLLCVAASLCLSARAGADEKPFSARATIAPTFGQSLFADTALTRAALRYELEGGVGVGGFRAGVLLGATQFLTERAVNVGKFDLGDAAVGASYELLTVGPLQLRPRIDVILPASKYSRELSLFFASHLGFDATVALPRLTLLARARLRRDIHNDESPVLDLRGVDGPHPDPGPFGFRAGGSRLPGREEPSISAFQAPPEVVVVGPINVAWATHLGLGGEVRLVAGLFADLGFGWTHTWSYPIVLPNNIVSSRGQPKRVQRNLHTGTAGIGWRHAAGPLTLEVRAGVATTGPASTNDGKVRFPWWNLESAESDDSVLDLQVTARY